MTGDVTVTVALGEYDIGWHDPGASLAAADRRVDGLPATEAGGVRLVAIRVGRTREIRERYPLLRDRKF